MAETAVLSRFWCIVPPARVRVENGWMAEIAVLSRFWCIVPPARVRVENGEWLRQQSCHVFIS